MFVTNDPNLYEQVLTLSNHGRARDQTKQFWPDMVGFKYKLSNIQAAIGTAQVERVDDLVKIKRNIFKAYEANLSDLPICLNPQPPGTLNGYWMPTIVIDQEAKICSSDIVKSLNKNNIDARVFFWPLSSTPCPGKKFLSPKDLASSIYKKALNLPSPFCLTSQEMDLVCNSIRHLF